MGSKITQISGFKNKKEYDDNWLIKPNQKSSKELIIKEWEQIKKIVVSLATKASTQSTIVSKLCSYERKNPTQKTMNVAGY